MKKFFAWLVIGAVGGSAIAEESSAPIVIQAQATPAATPMKRLAPKGMFFVLQRLATMTDSGVVSAVPGTKVTLVRDGSPMRVTDGQHEYNALASQLTNDMDIGEQLAQAEYSAKAKSNQEVLLKTQENQKAQQEQTAKAEEMARARTVNQKKIAQIRQQIKDARLAIFENKPGAMVKSPLFGPGEREEQREFILNKEKEVRDLQKELDELEAGGTAK